MSTSTVISAVAAPVGEFVKYKGVLHIVVGYDDDMSTFQILNPLAGNAKLMVKGRNLSATPYTYAVCVLHMGNKYLCTKKGTIISLKTGRVMEWDANNGNRKAILAAVGIVEAHKVSEPPRKQVRDLDSSSMRARITGRSLAVYRPAIR